jgi:hypothetical protein
MRLKAQGLSEPPHVGCYSFERSLIEGQMPKFMKTDKNRSGEETGAIRRETTRFASALPL